MIVTPNLKEWLPKIISLWQPRSDYSLQQLSFELKVLRTKQENFDKTLARIDKTLDHNTRQLETIINLLQK